MFHYVINYQHVSIASVIIIGVALQKYKKYNNLSHGTSGTTQCHNKYLKHWVFQLTHFSYQSFNATLMMMMTKAINTFW